MIASISGYQFKDSDLSNSHKYLLPAVRAELDRLIGSRPKHLFELGCGNGSVAAALSAAGWKVAGVDPSIEGITMANKSFPDLQLEVGSAYDDLTARFGRFPVVLSLEVVEHVYAPREYARTLFNLIEPTG